MHHRAEYLLQVLEKIGSPLLASVTQANARSNAPLHQEAQKIAELLAKSVHAGIEIGRIMDLGPTGEITDPLRLALTGLASELIAGSFSHSGKSPGEADIKKMVSALQAVLTFSDNFMADSETAGRLKDISAQGQITDPPQMHVQYIHAFIPAVNAIAAFPFGQAEQKLVMDISSRLVQEAANLRQSALGDLGAANKRAELAILSALAKLYAACHESETARIMNLTDEERSRQALSIDPVWENFALRASMLETLAKGILGSSMQASTSSGGGMNPAPPPVQASAPASPPPAAGGSPLGMFAKKPAGETPPPSPPEQRQPFHSAPPPPPPAQQQSPPPGGGPMSFFKPPPRSDGT
ncbi:MAG: hypothetical protein IT558_06150 [Alphaproteobacteria bacterium]|nr:hypothetical protein [Alphaproteobacteria bacterium]